MLVGILFVAGGALWGTISGIGNVAYAEVASVRSEASGTDVVEVEAVSASASLQRPPSESLARAAASPQADAPGPALTLPPQTGVSTQVSAQSLAPAIETVAPAPTAPPPHVTRGVINNVNITFYDCANQGFCGAMYNGRKVYEGAAACSWNLAIGTKFIIVGDPTHRIYICEDRGLLANTWVDIFWYHPADGYSWQSSVGRYGTIEIVSTP